MSHRDIPLHETIRDKVVDQAEYIRLLEGEVERLRALIGKYDCGLTIEAQGELAAKNRELLTIVAKRSAENERLRAALEEIAEGAGPFNRDPLTHAANCIEVMKAVARAALRGEGEK